MLYIIIFKAKIKQITLNYIVFLSEFHALIKV